MKDKVICQYEKGYKTIAKSLGLQRPMVRTIIHKRRKPGTVVNRQQLTHEVKKEPRITSKELQILWTEGKAEFLVRFISHCIGFKMNKS